MEYEKLKPLSGKIKVIYTIKEHPEYGKKRSIHTSYDDFGEWLCRQFNKINIINISDK